MQPPTSLPPKITLPGQGRTLQAFGETVITHLESKDTGGALSVWTNVTPPGGGPPPHYHTREDEWFIVQEGRFEFLVEGKWQAVPAGGTVFAPRGAIHTFKNVGETPGRMLISSSPGGFESFFGDCAREFNAPGGPDMQRIVEIAARYGIYFAPAG